MHLYIYQVSVIKVKYIKVNCCYVKSLGSTVINSMEDYKSSMIYCSIDGQLNVGIKLSDQNNLRRCILISEPQCVDNKFCHSALLFEYWWMSKFMIKVLNRVCKLPFVHSYLLLTNMTIQ